VWSIELGIRQTSSIPAGLEFVLCSAPGLLDSDLGAFMRQLVPQENPDELAMAF